MSFGLLYEHQLPRPWTEASEQELFQQAIEQVELADSRAARTTASISAAR